MNHPCLAPLEAGCFAELQDELTGPGLSITDNAMPHEALQALRVIRSIKRLNDCAAIARDELSDDPTDTDMATFVAMVGKLARVRGVFSTNHR